MTRYPGRILAFVATFVWMTAAAGESDVNALHSAALEAYDAGHYREAMTLLRQASDLGDMRAAEMLALMYRYGERLYGEEVRADRALAAHYTQIAAQRRRAASADSRLSSTR